MAATRVDRGLFPRKPPARDFSCEPVRYDVGAFEMYTGHCRLVRRERPELVASLRVPEPEETVGITGDHQAIGRERRVREVPRRPHERPEKPT